MIHDLPTILLAALAGFFSGLVCSIPVGPVNLTIMSEGARRGFQYALLIGIGASCMETIYCAIAFTGFASFFSQGIVKAVMEVGSFLFMTGLGVKFLTANAVSSPSKVEEQINEKFHPRSAYMRGFLRVLANPGVLLFWIILSAHFISGDWVAPTFESKTACILGVTAGTNLWFTGLSYAVGKRHQKFSTGALVRMERISGIVLIIFGLVQGGKIALELAKKHDGHHSMHFKAQEPASTDQE